MRKISKRKSLKLNTNVGAFDDSILLVAIERNQRCFIEISKSHYDRANDLIKQIKRDLVLVNYMSRQRKIIESLTFNTEAYLYQRQTKYEQALVRVNEALKIEHKYQHSQIGIARTLLNKCVLLVLMDKNNEAVELAKQALELLKGKKEEGSIGGILKKQYKIYQIMISSFYNCAVVLSQLGKIIEVDKIWKQGSLLAKKVLGPAHRLTVLLSKILKDPQYLSRRRTVSLCHNSHISEDKSSAQARTKSRGSFILRQSKHRKSLLPSIQQQQLKRIYLYESEINTEHKATTQIQKENDSYRKSLERIKELYRKGNYSSVNTKERSVSLNSNVNESTCQAIQQKQSIKKPKKKSVKTEISLNTRYKQPENGFKHRQIKQIILRSKFKSMSRSNYLSYLETYDQSQTDALKRKFTGVSDNVGDTGYSECQKYEKIQYQSRYMMKQDQLQTRPQSKGKTYDPLKQPIIQENKQCNLI